MGSVLHRRRSRAAKSGARHRGMSLARLARCSLCSPRPGISGGRVGPAPSRGPRLQYPDLSDDADHGIRMARPGEAHSSHSRPVRAVAAAASSCWVPGIRRRAAGIPRKPPRESDCAGSGPAAEGSGAPGEEPRAGTQGWGAAAEGPGAPGEEPRARTQGWGAAAEGSGAPGEEPRARMQGWGAAAEGSGAPEEEPRAGTQGWGAAAEGPGAAGEEPRAGTQGWGAAGDGSGSAGETGAGAGARRNHSAAS